MSRQDMTAMINDPRVPRYDSSPDSPLKRQLAEYDKAKAAREDEEKYIARALEIIDEIGVHKDLDRDGADEMEREVELLNVLGCVLTLAPHGDGKFRMCWDWRVEVHPAHADGRAKAIAREMTSWLEGECHHSQKDAIFGPRGLLSLVADLVAGEETAESMSLEEVAEFAAIVKSRFGELASH